MTTVTRLYTVTDAETGQHRLVEATNPAQAVRHVAGSRFTAKPASAMQTADLVQAGVAVERAGAETPTASEFPGGMA